MVNNLISSQVDTSKTTTAISNIIIIVLKTKVFEERCDKLNITPRLNTVRYTIVQSNRS